MHDAFDQSASRALTATSDPTSVTFPSSFTMAEQKNAEEWVRQNFLIAAYMASAGREYAFTPWWERSKADNSTIVSAFPSEKDKKLLVGNSLEEFHEYEWTSAGIIGRVVHETGKDQAN